MAFLANFKTRAKGLPGTNTEVYFAPSSGMKKQNDL
jgi:hypothetical protein